MPTATDPREALEVIDEAVDCVVTDYEMPAMDGLALFDAVRSSHPELPFVLFTAGQTRELAERVRDRDVQYVRKGPSGGGFEQLQTAVARALDD